MTIIMKLYLPPDLSSGDGDIVRTLEGRLEGITVAHKDAFIFITPVVILISAEISRPFLSLCDMKDREWRRTAVSIVGSRSARSPREFEFRSQDGFSNATSFKRERWYQWAMTCRGNMFPPGKMYPSDEWHGLLSKMRYSDLSIQNEEIVTENHRNDVEGVLREHQFEATLG